MGGLQVNSIKEKLGKSKPIYLVRRGLHSFSQLGLRNTCFLVRHKVKNMVAFSRLAKQSLYTDEELAEQQTHIFHKQVCFSILVPLYNTPEQFLREMIESVQAQTYSNWELCLADGSDSEHNNVGTICQEYAAADTRIRYRKLEKNLGISGNTNACIEMSRGDYIALFDHDDLLHPAALFEVMCAVCDRDADYIYTDENTFRNTPADAYSPHLKPDFAPDNLRANNYICHFSVFSRALLDQVGLFRPECDGSQDHDMILRLTEKAKSIVHIPKILYYWRCHSGSVAGSVDAKPYVIEAAHRAIAGQLERLGLDGQVEDTTNASMYRIRYAISGNPRISVIIPHQDRSDTLSDCLHSILEKTTYSNYDIYILNGCSDAVPFSNPHVHILPAKGTLTEMLSSCPKDAAGDYLLFLSPGIQVITPEWMEEMLMFAQRKDVGPVGAMLYNPDDSVRHAGIAIGLRGSIGYPHRNFYRGHIGYMGRLLYAQDLSAVSGACMMVKKALWADLGGFNKAYHHSFYDVDFCLRAGKQGFLTLWTPFAEAYLQSKEVIDSSDKEQFCQEWSAQIAAGDPYYNPGFDIRNDDFSV